MAFQVRVRVNKNEIKVLSVASASEEFEQFTIGALKDKALSLFPSVNDRDRLRVIFGQNELEDSQTFEECGIVHLSVLMIVLQVPGGRKCSVLNRSPVKMYCSWSNIPVGHTAALYANLHNSLRPMSVKNGFQRDRILKTIHQGGVSLTRFNNVGFMILSFYP